MDIGSIQPWTTAFRTYAPHDKFEKRSDPPSPTPGYPHPLQPVSSLFATGINTHAHYGRTHRPRSGGSRATAAQTMLAVGMLLRRASAANGQ
ncbi:hypothetical protein K466DRAFT_606119 [Polyporus arcularius HHB13444]|uniref:Uncharacterized protein n=1 Tax=Polyporus arcularius HHB13444 TaxID=1314778 RepID=A0A5C3NPK7_9APHY|nr:hypothetical protein K466DRAFT_606119 [Polyporus arcularius HHB13444]